MNLTRRSLFALGGAAAVAPMLPSVAQAAKVVAPVVRGWDLAAVGSDFSEVSLVEIDDLLSKVWDTYRIKPTHMIFADDLPTHFDCQYVLTGNPDLT